MNDDTEEYELKFKCDSYKDDLIYIQGNGFAIIDTCNINGKELICKITKEKLESILAYNNEPFILGTMNDDYGTYIFNLVYGININYEITKKEDITVTITKLLNNATELMSNYAYETKVNGDTPPLLHSRIFNIHSSQGDQSCYFQKNNYKNLLLICIPNKEGEIYLGKIEQEIALNDVHYRYNFRIQPVENNEIINVKGFGSSVCLIFPESLDLTSQEAFEIRYIMIAPSNTEKIKLNPDSNSDLVCKDLTGMKICKGPVNHFEDKDSGYYHTYHPNHLNEYSIYYDANPINIILPKWKIKVEIGIEDKDNVNPIKIGQKGVLYFVTNYKDEENIFDEEYPFTAEFTDSKENEIYQSECKLWKPNDNIMRIICQLNEKLPKDEQNIYMVKTSFVYKEDYNITINYKAENIKVKQLNSDISFLYSDKQNIDIKDNENTYKLTFKQYKYDNRPLYLYKYDIKSISLDECKSESNEVTCNVDKDEILEILSYSGEEYFLAEKLDEGLYIFNSVLNISFNYNYNQQNVNINIGKLLTPFISKNEFIAYEANTESNITSSLTTDYFEIVSEKNSKMNCIFKKPYNQNNLLLLCNAVNPGKNSLGTITQMDITNINIFYKFSIEQTENKEEFDVSNGEGTKITSLTPLLLNFTLRDNYTLTYETENPEKLNGIKLNNDSKFDLECEDKIWYKECIVNKTHFTKSGYYYTLHSNHKGTKTISYEAPMINVIVEEPNPSPNPEPEDKGTNLGLVIGLSVAAAIIVICLVVFLVWYYMKNKENKKDHECSEEEDNKNEEKKELLNDKIKSDQVQEEIKQSEANEDRINA